MWSLHVGERVCFWCLERENYSMSQTNIDISLEGYVPCPNETFLKESIQKLLENGFFDRNLRVGREEQSMYKVLTALGVKTNFLVMVAI